MSITFWFAIFQISWRAIRSIGIPSDLSSFKKISRLACLLCRLWMLRLRKMGFFEALNLVLRLGGS